MLGIKWWETNFINIKLDEETKFALHHQREF